MNNWREQYLERIKPSIDDFKKVVDSEYWEKLNNLLQNEWNLSPLIEYSKCILEKGWNIKYKKKGKTICTLFPKKHFFKAVVFIPEKLIDHGEQEITGCCKMVKTTSYETPISNEGKWLIVKVCNNDTYQSLIQLIQNKYINI